MPQLNKEKLKEKNHMMVNYVPELDSKYARFPLQYRWWYAPSGILDGGEPCFIASQDDFGIKDGYIYCPTRKRNGKKLQAGYYHLLTRVAAEQAFLNHVRDNGSSKTAVVFGRFAAKEKKKKRAEYLEVKRILYNRCISDTPDDVIAARTRLLNAQSGGDMAARFGHSAYVPVLTSAFLLGLS